MKKRILAIVLTVFGVLSFSGCQALPLIVPFLMMMGGGMGTYYETDPSTYEEALEYIDAPAFFPQAIEDYTINEYVLQQRTAGLPKCVWETCRNGA